MNKMVLSSDDDKRIKTFNCVKTFAYGTSEEIIYIYIKKSKQKIMRK